MIQGMETEQRVDLLLSLTNVRSEPQISALKRHFVDGLNASACAAFEGIPESNFQRVIDRLQEVDAKIEQIKDLDWSRFKSEK